MWPPYQAHSVSSRAAVLVCIVGVHAFVLILIFHHHPRTSDVDEFRSVLFLIAPNEPAKRPARPKKESNAKGRKPIVELNPSLASAPITEPATKAVEPTIVDWHDQAAQAAAGVAGRVANKRQRPAMSGLPRENNVATEPVPDSLFQGPLHKRGDSVRTEDGEVITWLDDKCYATNRDFGPPRESANSMVVVCKGNVGKRPIDGELLKHLRPKYLRSSEIDSAPSADKDTIEHRP